MIELIHGDCLVKMQEIDTGSVDMILCDLPYGTTACKWDTVIPFEPLWEQYKRIIKKNGAIVLFGSQPFTSALIMSNLKMFRQELIWEKDIATGFLDARRKIMKIHENIIIFSHKRTIYNPQMREGKPYSVKSGSTKDNSITKDENIKKGGYLTVNNGERFPVSIKKINTEKGHHPTQKPVALLEYLIKTYTNENNLVLDNCMGSGSTGVAAKNLNRSFIGIEKEENYFNIAKERINNA
jgi:site-specific DNA-methyltransferase (adenine-specific)